MTHIEQELNRLSSRVCDMIGDDNEIMALCDRIARNQCYIRPEIEIGGDECPENSVAYDHYYAMTTHMIIKILSRAIDNQYSTTNI